MLVVYPLATVQGKAIKHGKDRWVNALKTHQSHFALDLLIHHNTVQCHGLYKRIHALH